MQKRFRSSEESVSVPNDVIRNFLG